MAPGIQCKLTLVLIFFLFAPGGKLPAEEVEHPAKVYRSPFALAVSPDGGTVYVSDRTAAMIAVLDVAKKRNRAGIPLRGEPQGICLSPDGTRLYVAERGASSVAVIDTGKLEVIDRIATDRWPVAVSLAAKTGCLYVSCEDTNSVLVIDLKEAHGKIIQRISVLREPCAIALTPDERYAVVANRIPYGRATDSTLGAVVSILDTGTPSQVSTIQLPPGSSIVHGVTTGPDGKWAYVVHGLGRFNVPMTQLDRGWVNTYALSIIDVPGGKRLATVLLDNPMKGSADPFAVACSKDGRSLWITHSGIHEISIIDLGRLHDLLSGDVPDTLATRWKDESNIWTRIQKDRKVIQELPNHLAALEIADAIHRAPTGGKVPRGLAVSPDEKTIYVANYFSGTVSLLDAVDGRLQRTLPLGLQPEADAARRGELLFHDATIAFQTWHSCATCHPNNARTDGLRWDFADDGLGNGMDTPSLRYVDNVGPLHHLGTLKDLRTLVTHGFAITHMTVPTDEMVEDLIAYMSSLRADRNPHLNPDGTLTESARRGKVLFDGKADCVRCHPGPYFTDKKLWNVGVVSDIQPTAKYKSTQLTDAYRTAPYLHDGRALTLEEVLTIFNPDDEHGKTRNLNHDEIEDLIAYLRSL